MVTTSFTLFCAVASLIGAFLPAKDRKTRIIHILYGLLIAFLALAVLNYEYKIKQINKTERVAKELIKRSDHDFTALGFIHASLAFLEKHKDLYPDTYKRAQTLCEEHDCFGSKYAKESSKVLEHGWGLIDVKFAMKGILLGISKMTSSD